MKSTAKLLSAIALCTFVGSSALSAADFNDPFAAVTIKAANNKLEAAYEEMVAKKALRDKARDAWRDAKMKGDLDREEVAHEAFLAARKEVKDAVEAYHKMRKFHSKLKFNS